MENLTKQQRVVKMAADLGPVPGHDLVIFRQVGEGRGFEKVLSQEAIAAGEKFKPGWIGRSSFFAYAVNMDPNLRLEFSQKLAHKNGIHSFVLHFSIEYCVINSRSIAERIDSDPVKRLQDEIDKLIGRHVAGMEWNRIESHFDEVGDQILKAEGTSGGGFSVIRERIFKLAADLGIEVKSIELRRTLLEEDLELGHIRKKDAVEREKHEIEHEAAGHKKSLEQKTQDLESERARKIAMAEQLYKKQIRELELQSDDDLMELEQDVELRKQIHGNKMHDMKLEREFREKMLQSTEVAMRNLAENIDSAESFARAGEAVQRTFSSIVKGPQGNTGANMLSSGTPTVVAGLLPERSGGISHILMEALNQVDRLTCQLDDKKRVFSAILHLLAELTLGADANDGTIDLHGEKLKELSIDLKQFMSPDQFDFLHSLLSYDRIKEYIR